MQALNFAAPVGTEFGKNPESRRSSGRDYGRLKGYATPLINGGLKVAIFARLVLMLFAIVFSAGLGGAMSAALNPYMREAPFFGAAVGGIAGIFIGKFLGNAVVGKPSKD